MVWNPKLLRSRDPLPLRCGETLPAPTFAYETWGRLARARDNLVIVLHALSGNSHAARAGAEEDPGWWEPLFASGAPLGADRHFVLCANLIGGCSGSTGPSSIDPRSGRPYGCRFPALTIADLVEGVRHLLRGLDLDPQLCGPLALVGGSMGGMLVLEWAATYPEEVGWGIALCTPGRSHAQTLAFRAVQRAAILADPDWRGGDYPPERPPARGLSLARQIGMITYRSDLEFAQRFGREVKSPGLHFRDGSYQVQSYLEHQGQKFVQRFDANTYLYYSRAMDLFDLGEGQPSFAEGVRRIRSPVDLIAFSSDFLVPPAHAEEVFDALHAAGRPVRLRTIETIHGHDAFLIETTAVNALLAEGPPAARR